MNDTTLVILGTMSILFFCALGCLFEKPYNYKKKSKKNQKKRGK